MEKIQYDSKDYKLYLPDSLKYLTDRLILRKFEEKDYKGMFDNWASDYEVTKYVRFSPHKSYDDLIVYSITKEEWIVLNNK